MLSNADEILFRCSSVGLLMTDSKTKGELGETCKGHLIDVYVSSRYNRFTDISAKYLDKGNDVEEDSITTISRITKQFFKKNEERVKNEFIIGTPDLFKGESILKAEQIRDAKSSWDANSFFKSKSKKLDPKYYWQGTSYMYLTGAKSCSIDYCLNNTPYHILEGELRRESYNHPENETPAWIEIQIISNHVYDLKTFEEYLSVRGLLYKADEKSKYVMSRFIEIPLKERHFNFEFERNDADIERIQNRVIECRNWMNKELFKV